MKSNEKTFDQLKLSFNMTNELWVKMDDELLEQLSEKLEEVTDSLEELAKQLVQSKGLPFTVEKED